MSFQKLLKNLAVKTTPAVMHFNEKIAEESLTNQLVREQINDNKGWNYMCKISGKPVHYLWNSICSSHCLWQKFNRLRTAVGYRRFIHRIYITTSIHTAIHSYFYFITPFKHLFT